MTTTLTTIRERQQAANRLHFDDAYRRTLHLALAKEIESNDYDAYLALALACREQLVDRWLATQERYRRNNGKKVYYLSLEFLMGRYLQNAVLNMDLEETVREVMHHRGMVLEDIYEAEHEPGLGNGGLGRLAACFLDSLATCDLPAVGHGIRYQFGTFRQEIVDGHQVEKPDAWLFRGNPWEIARPEDTVTVGFGGSCLRVSDGTGNNHRHWQPADRILALPYDTPIPGYGTETVNTLRLWEARSTDQFDLASFNGGDYLGAVGKNVADETISKVLYPADHCPAGQELRLKQQYFFVAAALSDIFREFLAANADLAQLPEKVAIQLNDTHPVIAIPELMRLLVDEHGMEWRKAWDITRRTMAYTNHTLLPEALERWSVELLGRLLPRHLEIIYDINHSFLEEVRTATDDERLVAKLSIIEEHPERMVRMAHLAIVGCHSVNGVAELHSRLLKDKLFADFQPLFSGKFNNKTNGITPRRWLKQANPSLAMLISRSIGNGWPRDLDRLARLGPLADRQDFRERWRGSKLSNKAVFAEYLREAQGELIDPLSLFDVQVKRIHEYKRQLLNILRVIASYLTIVSGASAAPVPRTIVLGGKAAPSYRLAKLIVRLAHGVATQVNRDPRSRDLLRLIFLTNYGVGVAERVIPAADLSEQISTAGYEASGTGNMKLALNGALTIGTLDGANIEIAEAVGRNNIFLFGLTAEEVARRQAERAAGGREAAAAHSPLLQEVLASLRGTLFSGGEPAGLYQPILDSLLQGGDTYQVLADFDAYLAVQDEVDDAFRDEDEWTRKSILNVAAMGHFSSDRTIGAYAREIWNLAPSPGQLRKKSATLLRLPS